MWALKVFNRPMLARLMGVPNGFPHGVEQAEFVSEMLDSIFPVGPRANGIVFDAFVSNPEVNSCHLEALGVPTLLIHARDDPMIPFAAAQQAAERIPGSVLVRMESAVTRTRPNRACPGRAGGVLRRAAARPAYHLISSAREPWRRRQRPCVSCVGTQKMIMPIRITTSKRRIRSGRS